MVVGLDNSPCEVSCDHPFGTCWEPIRTSSRLRTVPLAADDLMSLTNQRPDCLRSATTGRSPPFGEQIGEMGQPCLNLVWFGGRSYSDRFVAAVRRGPWEEDAIGRGGASRLPGLTRGVFFGYRFAASA